MDGTVRGLTVLPCTFRTLKRLDRHLVDGLAVKLSWRTRPPRCWSWGRRTPRPDTSCSRVRHLVGEVCGVTETRRSGVHIEPSSLRAPSVLLGPHPFPREFRVRWDTKFGPAIGHLLLFPSSFRRLLAEGSLTATFGRKSRIGIRRIEETVPFMRQLDSMLVK